MATEDERQVSSPVQFGKQWRDPACKIGKDKKLSFLLVNLFQHCGVDGFSKQECCTLYPCLSNVRVSLAP